MRELVRCHSWFKGELNTYTYIGHKNAEVNLDAKWIDPSLVLFLHLYSGLARVEL